MSSVGSSDSSNRQDEVVRRNREQAQSGESDLIKKHKTEMRRMNEAHYAEIENLKQAHSKQMEEMQKLSHDAVSERDHKYQQEVEELRGMHRKALAQTADENLRREDTLRKASTSDVNQSKQRNDSRFEKLSEDYSTKIRQADKMREDALASGREAQQKAIAENRQKLEKAYEKQLSSVKEERNEKVNGLQNQYTDYRQNAEGRLKSQELRHMQDQHRSSDNLLRSVRHEREASQDSQEILRDGFKDGLETMRDRFDKSIKNERAAQSMVADNLKTNAVDRIDNQVRRLENEKEDLKNMKVREQLQSKQQRDEEIKHVKEAYGKNIDNYKEQRDEVLRSSNERNSKDIASVREEMGKQLTDTNRFYRGKLEENNKIQRSAYINAKGEYEGRQEQAQVMANQRVRNVFDKAQEEKTRLMQMQSETHIAAQQSRQEEVKALRDQLDAEKADAITRMQEQMRKQEVAHTEKLGFIVGKYEKQITGLKDQVVKEKRNGEENLKRTVDELQRAHKLAIDQVEFKNRDRMRQVSQSQSEELRTVNKRHEEKLDQVLAEVKKT